MNSALAEEFLHKTDTLQTGLTTDVELDAPDGVRALRVTWIAWDSDFRRSNLQIGDRIIAVDGNSLAEVLQPNKFQVCIGQPGESLAWQNSNAQEGQTIRLTVLRQQAQLQIDGQLLYERLYRNTDGPALSPGGPLRLRNDGFDNTWMSWYEKFVWQTSYILDYAWYRNLLDSRKALAEHAEQLPRIEFLEKNFPGEFTQRVREDWEKVRSCLDGKHFDSVDLEYRELGEKRLQAVKQAAQQAYEALRAELSTQLMPAFPLPLLQADPPVANRIVVELPWLKPYQIVNDLGKTYAVAASSADEYYLVQYSDAPLMAEFYNTLFRFRTQVSATLAEQFQFIGAIVKQPRMITYRDRPIAGYLVEILAVRAGEYGELFVDLRKPLADGRFLFAGESALRQLSASPLADDATPAHIIETMVHAIKTADEALWKSLFADWNASLYEGQALYIPLSLPYESSLASAWETSRKLITADVFDVRVDRIGPARRILEADPMQNRPCIDQVVCYVDHVGCFDGKYRTFMTSFLKRKWVLQSRNGARWRITEVQSI